MVATVNEFDQTATNPGQRGPAEHQRREQILRAAGEHFRHYGYRKTTVADLAKAIGLSPAYIYKFFVSKQAIGEAVCALCLGERTGALRKIVEETASPVESIRKIYKSLALSGARLFFEDRKMHDIVTASFEERWGNLEAYNHDLIGIIRRVLIRGRELGEFERKTSLEEACRAIQHTMQSFFHPILLEQNLDHLEEDATAVANLVLRSLAP
ncbi:TetR/AcrR family transcriptional regulator [Granulicella sibirica]|uniref:Transcriptional regulator, TetR family n=1 Tax=Granulicella sibirica TaxID=2479048 RepID=A0A4Q0T3S9_9BACT|nr:TetR/AcrR family transcriptional regulator [Granulicella sibirica]RXH57170.1 Transcriptional regulator, TetR family [Granulicella sibirica]